MYHQLAQEETLNIASQPFLSKALHHHYTYGVVIPYSSNLKTHKEQSKREERLSFYSAFALNAALELYEDDKFDKFILLSDATFGKERKSTGLLMKESLLRANSKRSILEENIILIDVIALNNTPAQIKALAEYQRKNSIREETLLLMNWKFHNARIRMYIQGFGLNANVVNVEDAHKYFNPNFKLDALEQLLPKEFEEREEKLRLLARYDKRGIIPRLLKRVTGPVITDIQKTSTPGSLPMYNAKWYLEFENIPGKEKLRQLTKR